MIRLCPLAFCLLLAGCSDSIAPKLCDEIPAGGCPTGRGGTCDDPLCEALYDCLDGAWVLAETCNGNAAGSGGAAPSTTGSGAGGACPPGSGAGGNGGGCTPVTIDHTGEQGGCAPDLQFPDCPAAAAEQCSETACLTGCDAFYLCMQGGWTMVAYCDAATCSLVVGGR